MESQQDITGLQMPAAEEALVSCLTSGKSSESGPILSFRACVIQFDNCKCVKHHLHVDITHI